MSGRARDLAVEDLCLYALGDVSPEELVALESALSSDTAGQARLRALIEATHQLALLPTPSAPPPRAFDKIWKRIEAEADKPSTPPSRPTARARKSTPGGAPASRWARSLPLASAIALAMCLVAGAMWYREREASLTLESALEATRSQLAQGATERGALASRVAELQEKVTEDQAVYRALGAADLRVCLLGPRRPDLTGTLRVIWRRGDPFWLVVGSGLSPAGAGQSLKLWGIREGQSTGAAILEVAPDGAVRQRVMLTARLESSEAAAVTIEPDGGVPQPAGEMLFFGTM
ncbi:MAG: anti-sigma factor [Deltaproteobacteria bacterium]|nr:anti-sigma factor [Deltaproteobacteria bacterium]